MSEVVFVFHGFGSVKLLVGYYVISRYHLFSITVFCIYCLKRLFIATLVAFVVKSLCHVKSKDD